MKKPPESKTNYRNDRQGLQYILEYGSHAQDPPKRPPRDIDIMYGGMSKEAAEECVRSAYPDSGLPIDACQADVASGKVPIFVPCDTDATQYKFLLGRDAGIGVSIVRVCGAITSVLREGAGVEKALQRLRSKGIFELNIREEGNYDPLHHGTYCEGRLALANAVENHFGRQEFNDLCDRLWCGPLLRRLSEEKPTNLQAVDAVAAQSTWWPEYHAKLIFHNDARRIGVMYDYGRWLDSSQTCEAWLKRLYGPTEPVMRERS